MQLLKCLKQALCQMMYSTGWYDSLFDIQSVNCRYMLTLFDTEGVGVRL